MNQIKRKLLIILLACCSLIYFIFFHDDTVKLKKELDVVYLEHQKKLNSEIVSTSSSFTEIVVNNSKQWFNGGLTVGDSLVLVVSNTLVENKSDVQAWKYPDSLAIGNADLYDLDEPYTVSKSSGSDTLIVVKDGNILKFIINSLYRRK